MEKSEGGNLDEQFLEWLIKVRGLATRPARDVLSRCRRIERTLGVQLKRVASTQASSDSTIIKIRETFDRNDVVYAFRLFVNYKNPRVKFDLYAKPPRT
jgi:hypothetical protein